MSMTIPIERLLEKTGDPYHLIIAAARRTRQLVEGAPRLTKAKASRETTIALHEIAEGKVSFRKIEKAAEAEENAS